MPLDSIPPKQTSRINEYSERRMMLTMDGVKYYTQFDYDGTPDKVRNAAVITVNYLKEKHSGAVVRVWVCVTDGKFEIWTSVFEKGKSQITNKDAEKLNALLKDRDIGARASVNKKEKCMIINTNVEEILEMPSIQTEGDSIVLFYRN